MDLSELKWRPAEITYDGGHLSAKVSSFDSASKCASILEANAAGIFASGGALFYHVTRPPLQKVQDESGVRFRYPSPPISELWHLGSCTFTELLEASRYFGFPEQQGSRDVESAFRHVRFVLLEFWRRKHLRITQIEESHILLELVDSKETLTDEEASAFIDLNRHHFGVNESPGEERDKKRNWIKKRFFTIGDI